MLSYYLPSPKGAAKPRKAAAASAGCLFDLDELQHDDLKVGTENIAAPITFMSRIYGFCLDRAILRKLWTVLDSATLIMQLVQRYRMVSLSIALLLSARQPQEAKSIWPN